MKKISFIIIFILLFLIIEFCCAYCLFEKLHDAHTILPISDEEALKKENIDINTSTKEYNDILQKTIDLKDKIEKEINEIKYIKKIN